MNDESKQQKGWLSQVWKTHSTLAKYVGLFGVPAIFGFLPKAATNAKLVNPDAGLFDIFTTLWGMMGSTIAEFAVPGGSIILGEIGNTISAAFNAFSGVTALAPAALPSPFP